MSQISMLKNIYVFVSIYLLQFLYSKMFLFICASNCFSLSKINEQNSKNKLIDIRRSLEIGRNLKVMPAN